MNDTNEEIVGRVLQGLRDTALPDGMESRILSAVRHHASATPVPTRSPWRIASLAGSVALASVVCALFFTAHRKVPQAASQRSQAVSMRAADAPIAPPMAATREPPKQPGRRARLTTALLSQKEALAVVSYPAPPMPLTEQERLLLRIVHQGDPVQIAMLDPIRRDARYVEERTEIQKFFTPSNLGDDK